MRIFYAFLVILVSTGLFFLPVTDGVYDFRTDLRTDTFHIQTGGAVTTANVTLLKAVYDADLTTVDVTSDDSDDVPVEVAYHSNNRVLDISGLAISTNRTLSVAYDVDALNSSDALNGLLDKVSWFWLICLVCFPVAAIVYLIFGMKK